jgi:D-alanyl-D-alanine carboxypeptidase
MIDRAWFPVRVAVVFAVAMALITVLAGHPAHAKPAFSALAVDARTGEILFARDIDGVRYPASLTKMMTLYVVFQELEAGRLTRQTPIKFSRYAASRAPSKLGVPAGKTITVDEAIRALVTKSANDVASAVAEHISGSEKAFAERMTRTARSIGMSRSTFRNASGLPNPQQRTTARDMATLGLRLQRDFPQHFGYFKLASFNYRGRILRNHNRLLGKLEGVDGIKTGYINASGFNLVTSAGRGSKRIVGVVMGGTSGNARNRYMAAMVNGAFPKARGGAGLALAPGKAPSGGTAVAEAAPKPRKKETAPVKDRTPDLNEPDMSLVPAVVAEDADEYGNSEDAGSREGTVAALTGSPALAAADAATAATPGVAQVAVEVPAAKPVLTAPPAGNLTMASLIGSVAGKSDSLFVQRKAEAQDTAAEPIAVPPAPPQPSAASLTAASLAAAQEPGTQVQPAASTASIGAADDAGEVRGKTWAIQIGAFPSEEGARNRLKAARTAAGKQLNGKNGLLLAARKDGQTLYRARFSGFGEREARDACKALGRKGLSCFAIAPQG